MKRLLISTFAFVLLAAAPAMAQTTDRHHRGRGHDNSQSGHEQNDAGTPHGNTGDQGVIRRNHRNRLPDLNRNDRVDRTEHRTDVFRSRTTSRIVIQPRVERPRNWNVRPQHFDFRTHRRGFEAPHRFHWRTYNRPRGWYAHRWTYGEHLPRIFWARDYWIGDWWMFDLPTPPPGYEWVRYGDDALLVNIYTGEVVEVEYDLFD